MDCPLLGNETLKLAQERRENKLHNTSTPGTGTDSKCLPGEKDTSKTRGIAATKGTATSADRGKYGVTSIERAGRGTRPSCQRPNVGKRVEGRVETRVTSDRISSITGEPITILRNPLSARSDVGKMDVIFPLESRKYKVSASVGVTSAVLPLSGLSWTQGLNLIRFERRCYQNSGRDNVFSEP
jgi:hypothetical protein